MRLELRSFPPVVLAVLLGISPLAFSQSTPDSLADSASSHTRTRAVSITLSPSTFSIGAGANLQLTATVSGSSNKSVTWKVNGIANGNTTVGTIDTASGYFFAPSTLPSPSTYTITATSAADTSKSASSTVSVLPTDPVGAVTASKTVRCPAGGLSGGTCYLLTVACDNIANFSSYVKVNTAPSPLGVVMFGIGTGGSGLYETDFIFGQTAVQNVLNAGYTTAQISFGAPFVSNQPNGWLQGPGGERRLACRYAATANWVSSTVLKDKTKPLCATGNSGGSAVIAYALSEYGLAGTLSMVELTSGPPMAHIDNGCFCNQPTVMTQCGQGILSQCYSLLEASILDPAWSQPRCTNEIKHKTQTVDPALFLSDSVLAPGASYNYAKTYVNMIFGGLDTSSAVPQGQLFYDSITSQKSEGCVADAPHAVPNVQDGATQISNDLINLCRVQP